MLGLRNEARTPTFTTKVNAGETMSQNQNAVKAGSHSARATLEREAKMALRGLLDEISTIQRQAARFGLQAISARTSAADVQASTDGKSELQARVLALRGDLEGCPAEFSTTSAVRNAGSALDNLARRLELQA